MRKLRVVILSFAALLLMSFQLTGVYAANRNIPSCTSWNESFIKNHSLKITGGSIDVNVPAAGGFMKYTATRTGSCEFIFENVKGIYGEELGSIRMYDGSLKSLKVYTRGGDSSTLKLRTEGSSPANADGYHLSRYGIVYLRKGDTVYMNAGFTGKVSMSVMVLPPGGNRNCKFNITSAALKAGASTQLKVLRAGSAYISWKSSNSAVASVSNQGRVTAKKPGKAYITATVDGNKLICTITVSPNYSERDLIIALGAQMAYEFALYPSTVHIRCMYFVNWMRNGYGDAIKRVIVDAYGENVYGGYSSYEVVVIKVPNKSLYSDRFLFKGNYYEAVAHNYSAFPGGVTVNGAEAQRIYKKVYGASARPIHFD